MHFQSKYVALGTVCAIEKGATGIQKAVAGEYPLVTTGEERGSHNTYQFDKAAVCIPTISSTGHGHASLKRIHYQEGKFALGSILAACIPNDPEQLSARFLYIYLSINKDELLVPLMQGTANVSLTVKSLSSAQIPLLPMKQQQHIISLYDTSTEAHQGLSADFDYQATLLARLRQAVLREAVQGRLVPQDATDEPAATLLARIRAEKQRLVQEKKLRPDKPLPPLTEVEVPYEVPAGWVWCRLGEVSRFIDYRGKTPAKTISGIRLITAKNIKLGYLTKEPQEFIAENAYNTWMTRGLPEYGDVLFTTEAPLGNVAQLDTEECIALAQRTILIRPYANWNKAYLKSLLLSEPVRRQIFAKASGMAAEGIKASLLKNIPIPLPPLAEQRRIVAKVAELLACCTELESELGRARQAAGALHAAALREAFQGAPVAVGA